jgi:GNAT superfamily N-acetyltransferase
MKIVDLDEQHLPLYFVCLEDWSDEVKEAGHHKEVWYHRMKDKGLRVKLALDDQGTVGGMIQYVPIEHSLVEGSNLYFINCIWVHGHKQGRGNFQHRGMGKSLLEAAETDARELGAKGMAAWGLLIPVWMRASWFKRHGYRRADRQGIQGLVWKPFTSDALPPRCVRPKVKPLLERNKVTVTAFCNGWCPAQNIAFERAKRAAAEPQFADKVVFREVDTFDRAEFLRLGISDALFINDKEVRTGPPPSYERIKKLISKQAKKVRSPMTGKGT